MGEFQKENQSKSFFWAPAPTLVTADRLCHPGVGLGKWPETHWYLVRNSRG